MTLFLGVTKDQLFRLRDRLSLPKRMDRALRQKPPRHRDPTPSEIRRACVELRAKHLAARRAEPEDRVYRKAETDFIQFKLERARDILDDELERLIDDFGDP